MCTTHQTLQIECVSGENKMSKQAVKHTIWLQVDKMSASPNMLIHHHQSKQNEYEWKNKNV